MSNDLLKPVRSSTLQAVAYDEASRTLFVQFRSAATYEYRDVPPETYGALLAARSVGSYFARRIRDRYETLKLEGDGAVETRLRQIDGFRAELEARDGTAQERRRVLERAFRALSGRGSRPSLAF
jgi:hypothetical protein